MQVKPLGPSIFQDTVHMVRAPGCCPINGAMLCLHWIFRFRTSAVKSEAFSACRSTTTIL